jgi:hypothetical protein
MAHHRNIIKRLAAIGLAASFAGLSAGPASASGQSSGAARCHNLSHVSCAGAQAQGSSTRRARASAHRVAWSQQQLDQLARAYAEKNPGWVPPEASTAQTPAQKTWTPAALDALANAYAALNPGWTRP